MPEYDNKGLVNIKNRKSKKLHQDLIDLIVDRMNEKGMRPYELADEAEVPRSYMYRFLEGCHSPTLDVMFKMFRILDIDIKFEDRLLKSTAEKN